MPERVRSIFEWRRSCGQALCVDCTLSQVASDEVDNARIELLLLQHFDLQHDLQFLAVPHPLSG